MCGIAGIISFEMDLDQITEKTVALRSFLSHRGPDDVGIFINPGIGLAHTRLSIIDLAGGHQPLTNEKQTIFLVANGEIYNYRELRGALIAQGHRFSTNSDCETILHLYEQYGKKCVEHLAGMYAFAIWDRNNRMLFMARDRFGIKPLYFGRLKDGVCFASEMTAIAGSGLIEREIDPRALYSYLAFSYVPAPLSILKNIEKVQPAEWVSFCKGRIERATYWRPGEVRVPGKQQEAVEELSGRLEESVKSHLVSDVPVAAFLSGGVDSSTVVAMARKHVDIETFCVSFPGTGVDEAPYARKVARHLDVRHHEVELQLDPVGLLKSAVAFMDEPFADSSALPTFAVCQQARAIAKVVLSGDGGDEVFGGYTGRYRVAALKAGLPGPHHFAKLLRMIPPWRNGKRSSAPEMLDLAALSEGDRYVREREISSRGDRLRLFGSDAFRAYEPGLNNIAEQVLEEAPYTHPVHRALWLDLSTSLTDDMLVKVDRMSMAHGLEVRVPMLDHHLVEFALSMPPSWLVSPLPVEGKRILRKVAGKLFPGNFFNRPKQGFVVPLDHWLNRYFIPEADQVWKRSSARICEILNPDAVKEIFINKTNNSSHSEIYALIVLEFWLRRLSGI